MFDQVFVSSHPLVQTRLAELRHKETSPSTFRRLVRQLSQLLFIEASTRLNLETIRVVTPLAEAEGKRLADRIGLVPVLRAGLGMVDGVHEFVPDAEVWHLGLYRDHETLQPVTYYNKLPAEPHIDLAIVLDPMLATGGSLEFALTKIKDSKPYTIRAVSVLASPEGITHLQKNHPDVHFYTAVLDEKLNNKGYILPGLGDAGDRYFGT